MAIVKVRVTLKDARLRAARAKAKRFGTTSVVAKRVDAPRATADRFCAPRAKDERIDATRAVARDECFDAPRANVERVSATRARAERFSSPRARDKRVKAPRANVERVGTSRAESVSDASARDERVGASRASDERVDAARARDERVGGYKARDEVSLFSVRQFQHGKATRGESFSSPHRILKDNSVQDKEDQNTSRHGVKKRQRLSDYYHPDMKVKCGSFDVSQQHVPCLKVKDRSEVKKDLDVLEDSSTKSRKLNGSKELQHKTNRASNNFATTVHSKSHHFVLERNCQPLSDHHRPYQTSMHTDFATESSVEVEHKDRSKVKGALLAYKEILSKSLARKSNWCYVRAAMVLKKEGKWVNTTKQVGSIRGVRAGDRFRYRAQLNIVGLHRQFTNGIDHMRRNDGKILATSIVDSGRYVNILQSSDILIYSGQGGKSPFDKTKPTNQTMEGGNLALRNSQEEGTPIRVIRRLKHFKGRSCYVYYGLYTVEGVLEESEHGVMIYKFRLRRKAGQPELLFDST